MIKRLIAQPWLRRPAALTALSAVALVGLLSGGYTVARAVSGSPAASTSDGSTSGGGSDGGSNVAGKVNTTDGRTVYAIKLKIVQTASETVDPLNAAVAVNDGCTDCTTVAIAFEGVVVIGSPDSFTPTNLALAYNQDCSGCVAFADAYQQVVQVSTRVRITGEGRRKVAAIRQDLNSLRTSDLSYEQIRDRVAAAHQAFADVLRNEIVPVGNVKEPAPTDAADISDAPSGTGGGSPAPAPSEVSSASPEPSGSADASSAPEASTDPSPAPSSTATATPSP